VDENRFNETVIVLLKERIYHIRPNVRRCFFQILLLRKGGGGVHPIFEALRINFKETVPAVKRSSFLLK
jgi:hypothetical protein